MSNDGTDHPAVIAHGSLSPQVGPAAHFAAGETRSATGPVPDILENPLLPLILSSHPHAGKKVRISTGVHTLPARRGKRSARSTASPLASALAAVAFRLAKAASVGGLSYLGRGAEAPALILALQFCTAYPHFHTFSRFHLLHQVARGGAQIG